MTFKHKLSCRLALLKDRRVASSLVVLAAAVVVACEKPLPLDVTGGGTVAQLVISPKALTLRENAATDFTAVGFTSTGDTASVAVSWSVTSGAITDTSSNGKRHYGHYKAPSNTGQVKVVATSNPGGLSDTATITVTIPPVSSVSVSPNPASVLAGNTIQLTATPLDSLGNALTGRTITWNSSNTGMATVNASGLVTGVTAGGPVTISATSEGQTGTTALTVSTVAVASVTVAPPSANLQVGQTMQFSATAKDANGNVLSGRAISWASSNPAAATVDVGGVVRGVAAGSTTITATSEGQSGTSNVTVTFIPVASVSVSPPTASVAVGQTVQLAATPKDANGNPLTGRTVTWSSSNTGVATVSGTGLVQGVTGGSATITATSEGQSGSSAITVTAAPVATVTVSPPAATLQPTQTVQLTATTKDAGGNVLTGRTITWASSNTAVATVSASGLVTAVATGTALVTATSEGKSGTAAIGVGTASTTACAPTGTGRCYYVDATAGNDGNPGDSARPFQTVQHAAGLVNPGDVVIVRNGTYTGGSNAVLSIGRGGTATDWVVFKSENKWGAILHGQGSLGVQGVSDAGVSVGASYVRIEGFDIRWVYHDAFSVNVDNVVLTGNHIHDIGRYCTDDSFGIAGYAGHSGNIVFEQNVLHDVGRLSPGEAGCSPATDYWQNHDHGIYHSQGNNFIVRNNVFYNFTHGWPIQLYAGGLDQVYIVNNTFAFPNPNRVGHIVIGEPVSNSVIANNIFYQPTTAGIEMSGGTLTNVTVENNMIANGAVWAGSTTGVTFVNNFPNTDPKLMNPGAFDFHLQAGSPAIGAGISLPYVTNDFDGVLRPSGAPYDIGAFQFH